MTYWPARFSILLIGFISTWAAGSLRADESSTMAAPATSASPNAVAPTETAPTPGATPPPPAATAPMATPSTTEPAMETENPATYTVVPGDTLWGLSHKFHTSIKKLKALNHLKKTHLKPGQVLKIPPAKATASLPAEPKKKVASSHTHKAQPAQGNLPASDLGYYWNGKTPDYHMPSGPLPAPTAQPVAETATVSPQEHGGGTGQPSPSARESNFSETRETFTSSTTTAQPAHHSFFNFFYTPPPSVDWGARFTQVARELGDRGLTYNEDWRPPGEAHSWSMDCSNTTRYLYRVTTGIQLPRTASDQYYYLHLQNKAWDVPQTSTGFADCNYLRRNLKAGDLLFWENTYKPDRQPPITHVMIFLGTNAHGEWMMAGSQSTRGGEHNRRHGGPDIYVFNPTRPCGGYSTWLGFVHHQGRFCAFGRPLEADKSKLAMAAND